MPVARRPYCSKAFLTASRGERLIRIPGRTQNFRINLDWTPNDDTLMYFSVTTGYRAGGFALGVLDARTQSGDAGCLNLGFYVNCLKPVSYDAETVTAFEIGYKGTWLDGRAQVNASIYRYTTMKTIRIKSIPMTVRAAPRLIRLSTQVMQRTRGLK